MAQQGKTWTQKLQLLARQCSLGRARPATYACVGLVVVAALAGALTIGGPWGGTVVRREEDNIVQNDEGDASVVEPEGARAVAEVSVPTVTVVVHVDGAVAQPGVYVLESGAPRINDAVAMAGGLTSEADTSSLNLAAPLADGQKIHVPAIGETVAVNAEAASTSPDGAGSTTASATTGLVNINTADATTLATLPGIGESTAAAIIHERETGGAFAEPADIMRVSGIGEKKFAKLEGLICV